MRHAIAQWLQQQGLGERLADILTLLIQLALILALAWAAGRLARHFLVRVVSRLSRAETGPHWYKTLVHRQAPHRAAHLAGALVVYFLAPPVLAGWPTVSETTRHLLQAYIVLITLLAITATLRTFQDFYLFRNPASRIPVGVLVQACIIIVWFVGTLIVVGILIGQPPAVLLGGLGAMTAVLAVVYKGPLQGFAAGIQIASSDLLRKGDWIQVPEYDADGTVQEIGLTTIKVQNFDKTITSIPSYVTLSASLKNWRGMTESGGRRIKRAIALDMNSVGFCTDETIQRLGTFADRKDLVRWRHVAPAAPAHSGSVTSLGYTRAVSSGEHVCTPHPT